MKKLLLFFAMLLLAAGMHGWGIAQINRVYIDPSRDNRQISSVIYYPVAEKGAWHPRTAFPLIVFGHGWILPVSTYSAIRQEFVSAGWIMAFPTTEGSLFPNHLDFALDLAFVVQSVLQENDQPGSELNGIVAPFSVLMGHSMGGGASVLAATNTVASALVTLAAANTDPSAIAAATQVSLPSLTLAGGSDTITPPAQHQVPIFQNMGSSYKSYVSFSGVGHLGIYTNTLVFAVIQAWLNYTQSGDSMALHYFNTLLEQHLDQGDLEFIHKGYPVLAQDEHQSPPLPRLAALPNPCNPASTIYYSLERDAEVSLELYDLKGRKLRCLFAGRQPRGEHSVWFDGKGGDNRFLGSGIYILRLCQEGQQSISRITLVR